MVREMMNNELENSRNLLKLWQRTSIHFVPIAQFGETWHSYGMNLGELIPKKITQHFKDDLKNKVLALWGLSFKPNTDDMREAPSLVVIEELIRSGAIIQAYDPAAMKEA